MPGPLVPLIIGGLGAGARILAGGAARQAARTAVTQGSRAAARTTARTTSRTAKKTTAKKTTAKKTTAKKTTTARRPAQKDVLTAGERAQLRAERDASRLASQGRRAPTTAAARKKGASAARAAERARSLRAKDTARARAANRARAQTKIKKLRRTALTTGASSLAYEAAKYASTVPKNTKNQMPMRPRNWNPNKGL